MLKQTDDTSVDLGKSESTMKQLVPLKPLELNKLPLLPTEPREGLLSALDHSPMIRETLREYLEFDVETLGVGITESIKHEYARRIDEINKAEEEIMKVQASNTLLFSALEGKSSFGPHTERQFDISEETAKKFNLIRFEDVKTSHADITYSEAQLVEQDHLICPLKDLNGGGPHLESSVSKIISHAGGDTGIGMDSKTQQPIDKTFLLSKNERFGTSKKRKKSEEEFNPRHLKGFSDMGLAPLHNKWDAIVKDRIIYEPDIVQFQAFRVGRTYLKKVMLANKANRTTKFEIHMEKGKGVEKTFNVVFEKAMHRHFSLAPGMHMHFGVRFKCEDLDDHRTWLEVDVHEGRSFRIEVRAHRPSPTLISEKFFFPSNTILSEFKKSAAITMDCGTRFLGTVTTVSPGLLNVGSDATYFISSEESWEHCKVPEVVKENAAHMPPFTISPVLFRLTAGSKMNLHLTFTPTCEGLHTEKLLILCDNFALRSIDVIGEAILFDPSHFCINAQSKNFDVCEDDFYDAIHCIDFGILRRNSSSTKEIRFTSECPVEVEYHWELQPLTNWPEGFDIKPNQLKFSPYVGTLCAISSEDMEITCTVGNVAAGVYKGVLCFFAENIPKISLRNEDILGERPQTEQTFMIELMYVELRLNVIDLCIELDPPVIAFRNDLHCSDHYYINAKNLCPWEVAATWKIPEESNVKYEIAELNSVIPPNSSVTFSFMLTAVAIGKFQNVLRLDCFNDGASFPLIVLGEVIVTNLPRTTFLCHDLGPQLSGTEMDFDLPIEYDELMEDYPLEYSEIEAVFNLPFKKGDELVDKMWDTTNLQNPSIGFTPGMPKNLHYHTILNKSEGTDLRLTSMRLEAAQHAFYVDTIAMIQDADVILDKEEITLGTDLYQRVPIKFKVSLISKSHSSVNFNWLPPTGADARHTVVDYEPKSGRLRGLEIRPVEITLTAGRPGSLEGLLLPCALENTTKVLHLSCKGYAQDVVIRISYPSKNNEMISFTWPRVPSTLLTVSEDLDMKDEKCCICFISKFGDTDVPPSWGEICETRNVLFTDSTISLPPYEGWPIVGGQYRSDKFRDDVLRRDFFHNWDSEDLRRRMITIPIEEKSEVVKAFAQHALLFQINAYEANNTLTIKVENLTPVHTRFEAEVQEFAECDETTFFKEDANCVNLAGSRESLIKRLGGQEKEIIDDLCKKIQPKAGLFLSLEDSKGQLRMNKSVEIKVTAFSNCWGVYFDHIVIRIPELPAAIIPVLIDVKGSPVWFTMSPPMMFKYPKDDPKIYFHEMLSRSTAQQKLFVYNDSFLPVKLAWTTYVRRPTPRALSHLCLPDETPPFAVNVQVHAQKPSNFCKVNLTDGYGDVDSSFYDVEPKVMYLKPKQTLPLTVRVNTSDVWFDLDHKMSLLRGAAHSFVYIDENEEDEQSLDKRLDGGFSVYRPDGSNIDPLVLKMETKIEILPLKTLNNENTVFVYKVRAYDVARSSKKVYEEGRCYVFQNASNSIAEVKFSSTGNLFIIEASINGETCPNDGSGITVVVRPGDIVELKTVLRVSDGDLRQLVYRNIGNQRYADDDQYPLTTIVITHRDAIQQVIPIFINVADSKIEVSVTSLDFDNVLLGDSKVLPVRIRCGGGKETFSCKIVSGYRGILKVKPEQGELADQKYVSLEVTFTPKECLSYYGMLVITPSIEAMNKLVLLFGKGSWNHKHHQRFVP